MAKERFELEKPRLKWLLSARGSGELKPMYTFVHVADNKAMTTDGYRMHIVCLDETVEPGLYMPDIEANALYRISDAAISGSSGPVKTSDLLSVRTKYLNDLGDPMPLQQLRSPNSVRAYVRLPYGFAYQLARLADTIVCVGVNTYYMFEREQVGSSVERLHELRENEMKRVVSVESQYFAQALGGTVEKKVALADYKQPILVGFPNADHAIIMPVRPAK